MKQIKRLGSNSSDEGAFWSENASVMPLINTPEVMTRDIDRSAMTQRIATKANWRPRVPEKEREGPRDTHRIRIQKNLAQLRQQQKPLIVKSETQVVLFPQL